MRLKDQLFSYKNVHFPCGRSYNDVFTFLVVQLDPLDSSLVLEPLAHLHSDHEDERSLLSQELGTAQPGQGESGAARTGYGTLFLQS